MSRKQWRVLVSSSCLELSIARENREQYMFFSAVRKKLRKHGRSLEPFQVLETCRFLTRTERLRSTLRWSIHHGRSTRFRLAMKSELVTDSVESRIGTERIQTMVRIDFHHSTGVIVDRL